jgi:DNA adenine methylase
MIARSFMGFASHSHEIKNANNGFRTRDYNAHKSYAREWQGVPDNLLQVAERFQGVTIEHLPGIECMAKYDRADGESLFYVDPPYVLDLRDDHTKGYANEMGDHEHREMAWALRQLKGKVIISGYPGRLYGELFADWRRESKETTSNGQIGSVARTEVIWMNF